MLRESTKSREEPNMTEHSELIEKHQIMVSPGIVIDDKLEFTGIPSEKRLREKLRKKLKK